MKIFKYISIVFVFFLSINAYSSENLIFGINIEGHSITNQNRIKKLSSNLVDKLKEEYKKNFNIIFFDDEKALLKAFKERKNIDALVISSKLYFENKELLKKISKNPFIYNHSSVNYSQLYLVANDASKIEQVKDIKDKIFIDTTFTRNSSIWLDYLTLKKLDKPYKNVIKSELISNKSSTSLLDVYFKKADFCIIEKEIYEDMLLLNPSLEKSLKIIEKSPKIFFSAFTTIHKDTKTEFINLLNEMLDSKIFKEDFQEVLKLLNLKTISRVEFEDLKEIESFYDEYRILREKSK